MPSLNILSPLCSYNLRLRRRCIVSSPVSRLLKIIFGLIIFPSMASRILANLLVVGAGVVGRALVQAYRQALANASKSGVAQESVQNVMRGSKTMVEQEARQILGISEKASWEEVLQASHGSKYDTLFQRNAQNGSFYLQSKVHRAKECLESVYGGTPGGAP
ncbi:hypothetical protein QQ045_033183 [Rhodiola kirilowii]